MRALLTSLALVSLPALAGGLNDTGMTQCTNDGTAPLAACTSSNTGDGAAYPRQDGRFGRDAAQAAGQLSPAKTGGGAAGFDFTPLDTNGTAITLTGTPPVPLATPSCTHDNVTNLTWEVKATSGLRSNAYTYTWTTDIVGTDTCGGTLTAGTPSVGTLPARTAPVNQCNTANYVLAVNTATLCGTAGWRLPTRRELLSIVHHGTNMPAIDSAYFPNTDSNKFWTSDVASYSPSSAWTVKFDFGGTSTNDQSYDYRVRLVRSGQ